jgi:hypothetical protein
MRLSGVGIRNFRSIGNDPVFIDLDKKVNVLIGANNCGKSNVIKALDWLQTGNYEKKPLEQLDQHKQTATNPAGLRVNCIATEEDKQFFQPGSILSFDLEAKDNRFTCVNSPFRGIEWPKLNEVMLKYQDQQYNGRPTQDQILHTQNDLGLGQANDALRTGFPKIRVVPQFRQIQSGDLGLDGKGIIKTLASWKSPSPGHHGDIKRFLVIQDLLRKLMHMPQIELDVDHKQEHVMLTQADQRLPLASYGTGIHELIILAIAVFSETGVLFCIEEPEIHLHPRLQKEFLRFLLEHTGNRYVITTHSNAFINLSKQVAVTHLRLVDGVTRSSTVLATDQALLALEDLGVRASDILQANSVIWVEGPSDRIYIKRWLEILAPDLREGIEYSIMFYGGRLLAHLSMEREVPEEDEAELDLTPLLKMNQHSVMVMDSDRREPGDALGPSKGRITSECQTSGSVCWLTDGREIENYLPLDAVSAAYAEIAGSRPEGLIFGVHDSIEERLEAAYGEKWKPSWSYAIAKPKRAREIAKHITVKGIDPTLRAWLDRVIAAIKKANE